MRYTARAGAQAHRGIGRGPLRRDVPVAAARHGSRSCSVRSSWYPTGLPEASTTCQRGRVCRVPRTSW